MSWAKIIGNFFSDDNSSSKNAQTAPLPDPLPSIPPNSTPIPTSQAQVDSSSQYSACDIPQQLVEENEFLYLQLPEDVKCVLDKLRVIQYSEKSIMFDQQMPNGEWQSPFATLEAALMSILLLTPT
ncbi:12821_t:CDS:2, partial [Funneliformis mosseae]